MVVACALCLFLSVDTGADMTSCVLSLLRKLLLTAFRVWPVHESLAPCGLALGCLTMGSCTPLRAIQQYFSRDASTVLPATVRKKKTQGMWYCGHRLVVWICKDDCTWSLSRVVSLAVCQSEREIMACHGFQPWFHGLCKQCKLRIGGFLGCALWSKHCFG